MANTKKINIEVKATGKEEAEFLNIGLYGTENFLEKTLNKKSRVYQFFKVARSLFSVKFKEREEEIEVVEAEEVK